MLEKESVRANQAETELSRVKHQLETAEQTMQESRATLSRCFSVAMEIAGRQPAMLGEWSGEAWGLPGVSDRHGITPGPPMPPVMCITCQPGEWVCPGFSLALSVYLMYARAAYISDL